MKEKKIYKPQSISASERWLTCTASLQYNNTFKSNANTLKGNLIHAVSELRLQEEFFGKDNKDKITELVNQFYVDEKDPNLKTSWDMDCQKTSDEYVKYAIKMYEKYQPYKVEIEKEVWLNFYGFKKKGYIDLVMHSDDYTIIIDLKSGRTKVETENNSQMLLYAIACVQDMNAKGLNTNKRYIISICQSLINNIEGVDYPLSKLLSFYESQSKAMNEIITGNLTYRASKKACAFCEIKATCNEKIKSGVV